MQKREQPTGMFAFSIVWFGQLISLLGTAMTQFALTIWAWQITGEATALALVGFFTFTPTVILSPIAGALVDRWNRKLVMMLSDLASGLATVTIFVLYSSDNLEIWHLYVAGAFTGAFQAFQFPAYSAAISTMIPKNQYTRANAMLGLIDPVSAIFAPFAAGALLTVIGIRGIMLIDIITFTAAISALLFVRIPQPEQTETGRKAQGSLWKESIYGFRYIFERPSLLGLQMIFFFGNLFSSVAFAIFAPMILARTNGHELSLGVVQVAFGLGGLMGGVLLATWGGPKNRVNALIAGWFLAGVLGTYVLGTGQVMVMWIIGAFFSSFFIPFINSSNQAIWQAKVAPDVQGRVFSSRRLIAQITAPVSLAIAGPLADRVFEPAMMPDGSLAGTFGPLVGTGPGAGMGLIFVVVTILTTIVAVVAYLVPVIRHAEDILPDHDAPVTEPAPAEQLPEPILV